MIEQSKVHFESHSVRLVGYLYQDTHRNSTQDTSSVQAAAHEFAAAGFLALTFDYRNFGESDGKPRQLISIQGQL